MYNSNPVSQNQSQVVWCAVLKQQQNLALLDQHLMYHLAYAIPDIMVMEEHAQVLIQAL